MQQSQPQRSGYALSLVRRTRLQLAHRENRPRRRSQRGGYQRGCGRIIRLLPEPYRTGLQRPGQAVPAQKQHLRKRGFYHELSTQNQQVQLALFGAADQCQLHRGVYRRPLRSVSYLGVHPRQRGEYAQILPSAREPRPQHRDGACLRHQVPALRRQCDEAGLQMQGLPHAGTV